MKKLISLSLVLVMIFSMLPFPSAAAEELADTGAKTEATNEADEVTAAEADTILTLPATTDTVEKEAFCDDPSFTVVEIPQTVKKIESRAFANCTGIKDVYVYSKDITIAKDAFDGCTDLNFYVYSGTTAETYAYAHGFYCNLIEPGDSVYDRALAMTVKTATAENIKSSLQGDNPYQLMRLIIRRENSRLPDISGFNPTEIICDGDIFIVQFGSKSNTARCLDYLTKLQNAGDSDIVFIEPDAYYQVVKPDEDVKASGVNNSRWDTDDPMGFDEYSKYIAENSTGTVTIGVLDSGISTDYEANYLDKLLTDQGRNFATDEQDWSCDDAFHGSLIASVISDVVGDANVKILPVRIADSDGYVTTLATYYGIKYAVDECSANIINLSVDLENDSGVQECETLKYAIQSYSAKGTSFVVSAGNDSEDAGKHFPANISSVYTVAGLQPNSADSSVYELWSGSNYGAAVDYCAPAVGFTTSDYPTSFQYYSGTSFSAPMIASALALLKLDPYHTIDDMNSTCYVPSSGGCGNGMPRLNQIANIPVSGITMDGSMKSALEVGKEYKLSWSVLPENATNQQVKVESSDSNVISVQNHSDGTVYLRAEAKGEAIVTLISDADENISVQRTFTVFQPITEITLSAPKTKLQTNHKMQMTVAISPADASYPSSIRWEIVSGENLATIDENGMITALSTAGNIGIRVTATDGAETAAASAVFEIEIAEIPDAEGVSLKVDGITVADKDTTGSLNLILGDEKNGSKEITASVLPEDAEQKVTFSSDSSNVTVTSLSDTSCRITAVSQGTAYITAVTSDGTQAATVVVKTIVLPSSLSISGETTLVEGSTTQLTATVLPENADDRSIIWSSSDPSVATVNAEGIVTAVAKGTVGITATTKANASVTSTVMLLVQHPYTVQFSLNGDGAYFTDGTASVSALSDVALGTLPTAARDYYNFQGWFTSDGQKITSESINLTDGTSVTVYAKWELKPESGWVLASDIPSNAQITATSYSYRETTASTSGTMSGWTLYGSYWNQTGTGSKKYASFPSGYNTSDSLYKSYNGSAYSASETETTKRTVSNTQVGYIYWHWMYNVAYSSSSDRYFANVKGTYGSSKWWYGYWYAFEDTTDYPTTTDYCINANPTCYNCSSHSFPSSDRTTSTSGLGTFRFVRTNLYKSTYTDYVKYYQYYRDLSYYATDPGNGSNISNKVTYYRYRVK